MVRNLVYNPFGGLINYLYNYIGVIIHLLSTMDIPVGFFNLLKAYDVTNFQDIFQIIANVKESHGRDQVKESPSKKQIQVPLVNAHPPNHS